MAPLLSSETASHNTLRTEKNTYKNDGKRVDAINFERDVRVDITCALSDDAIIAASNKECMLYFVQISLDGRLVSQVLFLQTPHIRIQRTVGMHVICFSVMDHSSLQTIVKMIIK